MELTAEERQQLSQWQCSSDIDAWSGRRARILEMLDSGHMQVEVETGNSLAETLARRFGIDLD